MNKFEKIVEAIKSGKTVTTCGNKVIAEKINHSWQTPSLRVELSTGASYPLEGNELNAAEIINNQSKVKILISIAAEGKGCLAEFTRSYTMKEHNDDKYIADGEAYALEHFNLKADKVVVQDWPVINKQLLAKIEDRWGSGDKVVPGHMAIPKVHNPMHSCFRAYRTFDIDGVTVLVKPVSAGIVYAVQNDIWVNELKVA